MTPEISVEDLKAKLDKSQKIVVHCRSGARSARAVQLLLGKGFDAVNVAGGILAWSERIDPSIQPG